MMAAAGKMVMQMTLAPGQEGAVKKMVMQLGAGDPMDMPVEMSGGKPFTKPNAKGLLGSETIKVAAGSFKTKHYRDKTPQGDKLDYWVIDSVPPFGLVKVEVEQKNNPQIKGKLVFELTAQGKDAKPSITKPAKPFDQAALMQQMMAASGGGQGGPAAASAGTGGAGAGAQEVARRRRREEPARGHRAHRRADAEAPRGGAASGRGRVQPRRHVGGGDDGGDRRAGAAGADADGAPARLLEGRARGRAGRGQRLVGAGRRGGRDGAGAGGAAGGRGAGGARRRPVADARVARLRGAASRSRRACRPPPGSGASSGGRRRCRSARAC